MTTVVCAELAPVVGDLAGNAARATAAVTAAAAGGADVLVLPELVTSGYCFESVDEARSLALPADDALFDEWRDAAGDMVVVAGFAELRGDRLFNSAVVLDGRGGRHVYRKVHLWDTEKRFFATGDEPPPVLDTAAGRVGVMVCYDLEFPEMTRAVALRGADLLAVPTNWPLLEYVDGLPAPEVVVALAAARVNRLPIACCDRRGVERGQRWNESTTIIDAAGRPVATADADGWARAVLDPAEARDKVLSPRNHALDDRVPHVYR